MNLTKDLHMCGICRKIFSDLNFFLEHKSQCSSQNSIVLSPNPHDISLDNVLFCNETVLDLTVLDNGAFLPILHCENEEVVSDAADIQSNEQTFRKSSLAGKTQESSESILPNPLAKSNDKTVIGLTNLPAKQPSPKSNDNNGQHYTTVKKHENHSIKSSQLNTNINCVVENEHRDTDVRGKTAADKTQKNVCNLCNFVTTYQKDLVRHMRKHTGERPYLCSICGKKFARQDKLTTHKRIHIGDKRYKCQLCEYATVDSGALKKHLQIHTDERPHKCQMCSYRARNSSHMTVHLRTHTGDSPFFCQFRGCDKTFKTSTDLKRHLKVHKLNPDSPSQDDGTQSYSCKHVNQNGKLFVKSTSCRICQEFTFKDTMKRKRGMRRKRGVQPHKCSVCSASFVRQDSLRSHLKLHSQLAQGLKGDESPNSLEPTLESRTNNTATFLLSPTRFQQSPNEDNSYL